MSINTRYGLYDIKDNCWLGNSEGPLLYEDQQLARIAARILDVRLGNPAGRTRAEEYLAEATTKLDDLQPKYSAEEAINRLEEGLEL